MPGRILGFDIGKAAPVNGNKRNSVAIETLSSSPPQPIMDHFKRPSLGRSKHSSENKDKKSSSAKTPTSPGPLKQIDFNLITESPPALLLDEPQRSSGALYSVKLQMAVNGKPAVLKSVTLKLEAVSTMKKPVVEKCPDCARQVSVVKDWSFISEKVTFQPGKHEFPASHLIPGHLPATCHGQLSSIDYQFVARAESESGQTFELKKPLEILRAIRPGGEKNSTRIFPPTSLNLNVTFPAVVHSFGDFNVVAKMDGLITKEAETQTRWRLRKLDWRIEEVESCISPACSKHANKVGGEGKGVQHEQTRIVGQAELKTGWKAEIEAGEVEGEFTVAVDKNRKPNNDVESPNGLKITHRMIIEMIIAEEWAPIKKPKSATPTGVARVLRTQFNLVITERAGMGISWDNEQPPLYEDVPASPPAYHRAEIYDGDELNDDVEHLRLGS